MERTAAAFRFSTERLPQFILLPQPPPGRSRDWFDRLVLSLGRYRVVSLESDPEFARRFVLRAHDADAVRRFLAPGVVRLLGALSDPDWHVEASGEWLVIFRECGFVAPEAYRDFLEQAAAIAVALGFGKETPSIAN